LSLKESEKDPDTGFLSRELFHHLHTPLNLLKAPLNDVCGSYMFPLIRWMVHVCNTGLKVLFQAFDQGRVYLTVFLYERLYLRLGLQAIRCMRRFNKCKRL